MYTPTSGLKSNNSLIHQTCQRAEIATGKYQEVSLSAEAVFPEYYVANTPDVVKREKSISKLLTCPELVVLFISCISRIALMRIGNICHYD